MLRNRKKEQKEAELVSEAGISEKGRELIVNADVIIARMALAAFFMIIIPVLLAFYLTFEVFIRRNITFTTQYARLIVFWMCLSGLFGYFVIRKYIKDIIDIVKKTQQIYKNVGFREQLEATYQKEVKDLSLAFNKVTSELEERIHDLEYSRSMARELFQKIGHVIVSTQKIDVLLNLLAQSTRKVLKAESCFIALYDRVDGRLRLKAYVGPQKDLPENMELSDKEGITGMVINSKEPMVVKKPKTEGIHIPSASEGEKIRYNNAICVPIVEKKEIKGVMGVCDVEDTEKLDTEDLFMLENLANHVGTSVSNFELNASIEETYYSTLLSLARAVEAKDAYSGGHLERVGAYAEHLAVRMGLDKEQKKILKGGAILHDLGKVGITDSVLNKPGKYTEEEYAVMKQHTVIGENILKPLRSMTKLAQLVRSHHECWDGSGYPDGLKGEEIPLVSRIITIADIYDALTTERAYKKAMPTGEAVKILQSYAGTKLDPKLVDVFIEVLKDMEKEKATRDKETKE
ncbi:MAG: HD domain-containing protein [Candidatus Omnitrophica bacterium]|nr:HD domain-containing protein [Candidatus Omnitrophota bacterium]MDD5488524.1 HD domain-containing protein [Candidatus Omnitrophota bacterium]